MHEKVKAIYLYSLILLRNPLQKNTGLTYEI